MTSPVNPLKELICQAFPLSIFGCDSIDGYPSSGSQIEPLKRAKPKAEVKEEPIKDTFDCRKHLKNKGCNITPTTVIYHNRNVYVYPLGPSTDTYIPQSKQDIGKEKADK